MYLFTEKLNLILGITTVFVFIGGSIFLYDSFKNIAIACIVFAILRLFLLKRQWRLIRLKKERIANYNEARKYSETRKSL